MQEQAFALNTTDSTIKCKRMANLFGRMAMQNVIYKVRQKNASIWNMK